MKRKGKLLVLCLTLILVLTACGSKTDNKKAEGNKGKEEKKVIQEEPGRQDGILDICIASEPDSIDPALNTSLDGATMVQHMFEGLIKWENDGNGNAVLKPGQADKWEVSDDKLTYTFHIRDGAKWSDGKPVTANDFLYSWNRLVDPNTGADYEYMLDMVDGYDAKKLNISAPDEKTFVVKLHTPTPYFEEICAFAATYPVRKDIVEGNDKWTLKPETYISNGPYKLASWEHNQVINMEKNPEYYDADKITAEKLAFHLKDDDNAIYASYRAKELDFIESVPTEEVKKLIDNGELKINPQVGTYFVCFNTSKPPFDNVKVRKAFSLAIDRNFIVEQVTGQGQQPASGFVPSGVSDKDGVGGDDFRTKGGDYYSINADDYTKNVEEAKKLLKEAGYPNGKGFPQVEYIYNTSEGHKAVAEALQNMWQTELGVTITLQNSDWNVFLKDRKEGNYNIARHGWVADYNDPMSFIDMWMTGGGNNDAQYSNPEFDKLVKEAKTTNDTAKRFEDLHKAEDIAVKDDAIVAPIYFYTSPHMIKPNIEGLFYTPLGYYFFGETKGF